MLQQASKLLLHRSIGWQHAVVASTCLQQHTHGLVQQHSQYTQQTRSKSSAAGPVSNAADSQQSSSGWSWFVGSSQSAAPQPEPPADDPAAAAAVAAAADPASLAAEAAPVAAPAVAQLSAAELVSQADVLAEVSSAATEATIAAAYASCWWGTRKFMDIILWTHDYLPWFEAICAANVLIRLGFAVPIAIIQQRLAPIMANMRVDTEKLKDMAGTLAKSATAGEYAMNLERFQQAKEEFDLKYKGKKRYTLLGPALGFGQMALFISQYSAISTLANAKLPSMTYEGALWFTNLTAPDPFMVLPVICAGVTLVQFNSRRFQDAMMMAGPGSGVLKPLMNFMAVFILVVGYFQPSGIALLWATNSVMTIGQNALLGHAGFRKQVGLPPTALPLPSKDALSWGSLFGSQKSGTAQPVAAAAAAAAGAPPPGTPVAVNYVARRPSKKQRSKAV